MRCRRPVLVWCGLPTATLVLVGVMFGRRHAQTIARLDIVTGLALPALDRGLVTDDSRVPGSPEQARRRALQPSGLVRDRVDASGAHVITNRLIVKFRDG